MSILSFADNVRLSVWSLADTSDIDKNKQINKLININPFFFIIKYNLFIFLISQQAKIITYIDIYLWL